MYKTYTIIDGRGMWEYNMTTSDFLLFNEKLVYALRLLVLAFQYHKQLAPDAVWAFETTEKLSLGINLKDLNILIKSRPTS